MGLLREMIAVIWLLFSSLKKEPCKQHPLKGRVDSLSLALYRVSTHVGYAMIVEWRTDVRSPSNNFSSLSLFLIPLLRAQREENINVLFTLQYTHSLKIQKPVQSEWSIWSITTHNSNLQVIGHSMDICNYCFLGLFTIHIKANCHIGSFVGLPLLCSLENGLYVCSLVQIEASWNYECAIQSDRPKVLENKPTNHGWITQSLLR